jgi:signal transduction histidine kinase/ligand-binding sensor domain-containing protein
MNIIQFLIFLVLYCLINYESHAQDFRFSHLTTDDGLPENTGQAILQDNQGFIWIGTQNGLARFDGFNFTVFKHQNGDDHSLSNNQVEGLLQDEDGFIWVATRNGLNRFNTVTQKFSVFFPDTTVNLGLNWFMSSLKQDSRGRIWALTFYGLYCIEDWARRKLLFYPFQNQHNRNICSFTIDESDEIWYNIKDSLFLLADREPVFQGLIPVAANAILDTEEELIFATQKGVFTWNKQAKTFKKIFGGELNDVLCLNLYRDHDDRIWVLTDEGVFVYQNNQLLYHFSHSSENPESLSNNLALDVLQDAEGIFWIGTGQGVNLFDPTQNQFLRIVKHSIGPIKLPGQQIEVIHFSDPSTLWIATSAGILKVVFKMPATLSTLKVEEWPILLTENFTGKTHPELAGENTDFIANAPSGGVFISTASGKLFLVDKQSHIHTLNTIPDYQQLRSLYLQPGSPNLWCGSGSGLYVIDLEKNQASIPDWLPDIDVVQFGEFRNALWTGSPEGLFVVDPVNKKVRKYTTGTAKGNLANTMLTHTLATDTALWFTTFGGGLGIYFPANDSFANYGETRGLSNANAWCVYPDSSGKLWLSTDNGVAVFDPKRECFKNYTRHDGLNFSDFSMTAHAQSATGELWLGNPFGLTVFHPDKITEPEYSPATAITHISLNYEPNPETLKNILQHGKLSLKPSDKTVTFSMAGLSFRDPQTNRMAFKLNGYDADWVYRPASKQQITYTSLPPGNYSLLVKSATKSGHWGEPFNLAISVIPPFYQTLWFRIIAALFAISLIGVVIFIYNRRKYRSQIQELQTQQKLQKERQRISRDLHDHVGANLTRIITDLDILSFQINTLPAETNLDKIEVTRSFTQSTIELLRDTIWAINKDSYSVAELARKAEAFLQKYLADIISWRVECKNIREQNLTPNQVLNLLRILQEATQNMLKHAAANDFTIYFESDQMLIMRIIDNGKGMPATFDKTEHYGLKNMQQRAEDIGGSFSLQSSPGNGIIITIEVK